MIQHYESEDSRDIQRTLTGASQEITYVVTGDPGEIADEFAVTDYLLLALSPIENGLNFDSITEVDRISDIFYKAKVLYQSPDFGDSEEEESEDLPITSIDTTGGTTNIDYGLSVAEKKGKPSEIIGAGLNWDGETFNGIDITTPAMKFSQRQIIPNSQFTLAFRIQVYRLTGKINNAPFQGFGEGDVLFLGATATEIIDDATLEKEWEVTYNFSAIETRTNIKIGDYVISKKEGYQYLWTQFEKREDRGQFKLVPVPIASYVVDVYEKIDFAILGIL